MRYLPYGSSKNILSAILSLDTTKDTLHMGVFHLPTLNVRCYITKNMLGDFHNEAAQHIQYTPEKTALSIRTLTDIYSVFLWNIPS